MIEFTPHYASDKEHSTQKSYSDIVSLVDYLKKIYNLEEFLENIISKSEQKSDLQAYEASEDFLQRKIKSKYIENFNSLFSAMIKNKIHSLNIFKFLEDQPPEADPEI